MAEDMFAQKGWICPKCGRVLAPSTMYCLWCCSDMKETITTTTTTTTTPTTIPKWDTTPITVGSGMINSSGTHYLVKTSSISRDSHEIAKDEPHEYEKVVWHKDYGYMTAEQTEDYRKMLDKAEHKVYGNIEDEPQTDCAWK